jgi:hypothetical protein
LNLEDIPRKVLSHTGCTVCGFLIALWCQETTITGQRQRKVKAGFTITLKDHDENPKFRDLDNAENLAVISQNTNESCNWRHSGAVIKGREQSIQLIGDIEHLESAVKIVDGIKAGQLKVAQQREARSLPTCHELPLITYGPHP